MKRTGSLILMTLFIVFVVLVIILTILVFSMILTTINAPTTPDSSDIISIASWNLENFDPTKAANETLLNYYTNTLDKYEVFIIQEIRDPTGAAIEAFARKLSNYHYLLSIPAGQGSSKEQYAIFYRKEIKLMSTLDWTESEQDTFERPPYEATFMVKNWTFTLITMHAKLNNVSQELTALENLIGTPTQDTIILGDVNADGDQYYNGVPHHFLEWHWVITSEMDTTVAKSRNAYDRIIINDAAQNNLLSIEIMTEVDVSQSDHYLVSASFNPNER